MRTVDLSVQQVSVSELLEMARSDPLLVKTADRDSFVLSAADELATELELLRRNHHF